MNVVAYVRVSTDPQDTERQRPILLRAAERLGHDIVAWCEDHGVSAGEGKMPTLERPGVQEAFRLAALHKARGILVENVDRWTRKGPTELGYSHFVAQRDHGVALVFADLPTDPFAAEILPPLMAALARMDNRRRSDLARSGVAQRRARGQPIGRPPKPALTDGEFRAAIAVLHAGAGIRRAAHAVSRLRGADDIADERARRRRRVSASWLKDQLANRSNTILLLGRSVQPSHPPPFHKAGLPEQGADA